MERSFSRNTCPAWHATQTGTTLLEVLVAIFITGVGLLALLTLFPLGALEMARAIDDDRTTAFAADAVALSQTGEELLSRTADFVEASLSTQSVDPVTAAQLREDYQQLALQVEGLEVELQAIERDFPRELIQPYLGPLSAQIRSIKRRIIVIVQLLSLLETGAARSS